MRYGKKNAYLTTGTRVINLKVSKITLKIARGEGILLFFAETYLVVKSLDKFTLTAPAKEN